MPNRLAAESSPYLLQHAENPVDWRPWGSEAFELARAANKPVFLSIGYSSCHWCHVMAHESFEDEATAAIMNELFVNVKVDREERPDVDEAYMTFIQILSGRGGWPTSVFMTPEGKPFFGGTYWPNGDTAQYRGFRSICSEIGRLWRESRSQLTDGAEQYALAIQEALVTPAPIGDGVTGAELTEHAIRALESNFDGEHGGFGGAPKFPPHTGLELLLAYAEQPSANQEVRTRCLDMAFRTLECMALGGIHDHVGGGFHRYSTDRFWLVPHWEKMLYDNALMLANYANAAPLARESQDPRANLFWSAAAGIISWIRREMTAPDGTFYSALDADSGHGEGEFYVWSYDELAKATGGSRFGDLFGAKPVGNFRDESSQRLTGENILHLKAPSDESFSSQIETLRSLREARPRPQRDEKVLVGWNGLMIAGLAAANEMEMAGKAAESLLESATAFGRLPHQVTNGVPSGEAFLDDYAFLAYGLLELSKTDRSWVEKAHQLCDEMVGRFFDEEAGGFYSTGEGHEKLFGRTKPIMDQPLPSGNAIAIRVLRELGDDERVALSLSALAGWMERAPHATEALHTSALGWVPKSKPILHDKAAVSVSLESQESIVGEDGVAAGVLRVSIPEGWHLNGTAPADKGLTPVRFEAAPFPVSVVFPEDSQAELRGEIDLRFGIHVSSTVEFSGFEIAFTYQACSDRECLPPQTQKVSGFVKRR